MLNMALAFTAAITACTSEKQVTIADVYPIGPVPFTEVKVNDGFWGDRLKASRDVTIPLAFSKCEETGRYDNFVRVTQPDSTYEVTGYPFDDTDVYKTIEGASYLLQTYPDPELEAYIDSILVIVGKAQQEDGYLNTARDMNPWHPHGWMGHERWALVEICSHEFYNLGHMLEAAVAHYQATGKWNFLDIAIKYADCICREIGDGPGQKALIPGHQIAEMGLAKLYLITGDEKYLKQAQFFLDKRGHTEKIDPYCQSHLPVVRQTEAVGHAVRAEYMYAGMADVAAMTGNQEYIDAIDAIWNNIVEKKMYITGGVGAHSDGERFGDNYDLPNLTSYCETCAAIGHVYTSYRMFLLHGESKYIDVLERSLYNGLISGISLEGNAFFYPNPLESDGSHLRQAWFGCACCPSNVCRFIPSVPGYVYASKDKNLYVNLYMSNSAEHELEGRRVAISQETDYPWSGNVRLSIDENKAGEFRLLMRIPGWVRGEVVPGDLYTFADDVETGYAVSLNGERVEAELENGYFVISRKWKKGDVVELEFDMPARYVKANEKVEADRGRYCVERGPLVYCAEWVDNEGVDVREARLSPAEALTVESRPELLHGIDAVKAGDLTLIPYYAWNHRGAGNMAVWLKEKEN